MKMTSASAVGVALLLGTVTARADITFVITTDSNLTDNGGVDQHDPSLFADGAAHTVYIWGMGDPATENVGLFNFDLNSSGSALAFSNATIGPSFTGSFVDDNLNDLQIGWSIFGGTVGVPMSPPMLFATLEVAVALQCAQTAAACTVATQAKDCPSPGDSCVLPPAGASTILELQGPEYSVTGDVFQSAEITSTGSHRDLLDDDPNEDPVCGDGLVEGEEECDPPDGIKCDANCQRIPRCGDGILDLGETCDDGNTSPGDGCDALCQLETVPNDDCSGAITVFDGQTPFFTNGATTDGPIHVGVCEFDGQAYNDVWYDYTASCTGELSISLCDSYYDTVLIVYLGCPCPLSDANVMACNDDGCPGPPPEEFQSQLTVTVVQGNCYKIRVGGWEADDAGTGTIHISCPGCRADDDCDDGLFCNGTEMCSNGICRPGEVPCEGELCDEVDDMCVPTTEGDADHDGDTDLDDLVILWSCLAGPGAPLLDCEAADFDGDGDVDLADVGMLQSGFTGPRP